jgi:hypothetical protein
MLSFHNQTDEIILYDIISISFVGKKEHILLPIAMAQVSKKVRLLRQQITQSAD